MLVEKESIETFEKAMADFKEAASNSENVCYDAAIVANSASAHLSSIAKRIQKMAENGKASEELLAQIINYIKKKHQEAIAAYVNKVLVHYYFLLKSAECIARNTATREQKQELEALQSEIDEFEDIRSRLNTRFRNLLSEIARRYLPEHTSPAGYAGIAKMLEDYLENPFAEKEEKFPPLKEDLDELGRHIKRQIELRFRELLQISEKILAAANTIEKITK